MSLTCLTRLMLVKDREISDDSGPISGSHADSPFDCDLSKGVERPNNLLPAQSTTL